MAEIIASPDNLSSYLWDIALGMSAGLLSFKVNGYPLSSGLLVIGLVASAGIFALDFVSLVSMGLRRMRITMRRLGTRVARVAGMRVRGPNGLMIAIRGSIGTVVAAGVHRTLVMTLRRPSAVRPILVMLHGPASVRPVVVPRFSSRYHIAPFELARSSAGSNYRASVIFRGPLSAIGARGVFMFDLLSARFEVMLVPRDPFALAYASLDPVRTAIEADAIDIVHHHRAVVRIVNHRDVDVGHGAIVDKLSATPFAAPKAYARVAVAIIDPAIKADVRAPVAAMPHIDAFRKAPITRRPQQTRFRRQDPRSRHPVISFVSVSPISRRPDVAGTGADRPTGAGPASGCGGRSGRQAERPGRRVGEAGERGGRRRGRERRADASRPRLTVLGRSVDSRPDA